MTIHALAKDSICPILQVFLLEPQILHDQALVDEAIEDLADSSVLDLLPHLVHLGLLHLVQHKRLRRFEEK